MPPAALPGAKFLKSLTNWFSEFISFDTSCLLNRPGIQAGPSHAQPTICHVMSVRASTVQCIPAR